VPYNIVLLDLYTCFGFICLSSVTVKATDSGGSKEKKSEYVKPAAFEHFYCLTPDMQIQRST
jgi:hypothetical protein